MTIATFTIPLVLGFASGFAIRFIMKFLVPKSLTKKFKGKPKNLGIFDRLTRVTIGISLIIATRYLPEQQFLLLLVAGFTFFESFFSWCVFYQAIGKDTCPR